MEMFFFNPPKVGHVIRETGHSPLKMSSKGQFSEFCLVSQQRKIAEKEDFGCFGRVKNGTRATFRIPRVIRRLILFIPALLIT